MHRRIGRQHEEDLRFQPDVTAIGVINRDRQSIGIVERQIARWVECDRRVTGNLPVPELGISRVASLPLVVTDTLRPMLMLAPATTFRVLTSESTSFDIEISDVTERSLR